jgi:hypothetical protein
MNTKPSLKALTALLFKWMQKYEIDEHISLL